MNALARFFSPSFLGCLASVLVALVIPGCPPLNPPDVKVELQVGSNNDEVQLQYFRGAGPNFKSRGDGSGLFFVYDTEARVSILLTPNPRDSSFLPPNPPFNPGLDFDDTKFELEFSDPGVSVIYQEFRVNREEVRPDLVLFGGDGLIRTRIIYGNAGISFAGGSFNAWLRIDPSVPLRPVFVSIRGTTRNGLTVYSERYPLYLQQTGGLAPRIREVTVAAQVFPNTQVPISLKGENFDVNTQIRVEDTLGIDVLDSTFDAGTGTLSALLDLSRDARTGHSFFHVENLAGGSEDHSIVVTAPRTIDVRGFYPSYGVVGSPVEVTIAGEGFHEGMMIASAPVSALDTNPVAIVDSQVARTRVTPEQADGATPAVLDLSGIGGIDGAPFPVKPRGFRGPRLTRVDPPQIIEGTRNVQIEVTGQNFDLHAPTGFDALANDAVGRIFVPGDGRRVLPRAAGAPQRVVLLAQPDATAHRGPFEMYVGTAGGFATNVVRMELVRPPPLVPFAAYAQMGKIARDGVIKSDVIIGQRLTGVRRIVSATRGLEVVSFSENPGGTMLTVMVRALTTAPLTGEARTVFNVITDHGTSNDVGYLVEAGGGAGGLPRIDLLAPNWVYKNSIQNPLSISGANFSTDPNAPAQVRFTPDSAVQADLRENSDTQNIFQRFDVVGDVPSLGIRVFNASNSQLSNTVQMPVLDPATQTGPEFLDFSVGAGATAGTTTTQFLLDGDNLVAGGVTTVTALPIDDTRARIVSARFFPKLAVGGTHAGVLEVQTEIAPAALEEIGLLMTLRRGDGLTTSAVPVTVYPAPAAGPFISAVAIAGGGGAVPRDAVSGLRIFGSGFTGATDVLVNIPGVTRGATFAIVNDGEVTTTIDVADNAAITGDALTTVKVVTPAGTSNAGSFIIVP